MAGKNSAQTDKDKIIEAVLKRDNCCCSTCGKRTNGVLVYIMPDLPSVKDNSLDNYVTFCKECARNVKGLERI